MRARRFEARRMRHDLTQAQHHDQSFAQQAKAKSRLSSLHPTYDYAYMFAHESRILSPAIAGFIVSASPSIPIHPHPNEQRARTVAVAPVGMLFFGRKRSEPGCSTVPEG